MRRLKIGIKPQLIILVCFSSLFSLLILAIVSGVYFSYNLSSLRADRLAVIAQLKTSQVKQSFEYIFYQVYFLSTKDTLYSPLISYRSGNNSASIFNEAQDTLDQFMQSSETFAAARLYNLNLDVVADSYSNLTNISIPTMDLLYPLAQNASIPEALLSQSSSSELGIQSYLTGPTANNTEDIGAYFMGLTIPVYANTSILINSPSIAGYLSVIASAANIQSSINDSSGNVSNAAPVTAATAVPATVSSSSSQDVDYTVLVIRPHYDTVNNRSRSNIAGFETVFPSSDNLLNTGSIYPLSASPMIKYALTDPSGGYVENIASFGQKYAMGYTQVQLTSTTYWTVIIQQTRGVFTAPVKKLRNIIIGIVIGIGVFMCLLTFPLAVWFVRPITKLKEATEAITTSKKRGLAAAAAVAASHGENYKAPPPYATSSAVSKNNSSNTTNGGNGNTRLSKRNSVNSAGSNSVYSYGIFLPGKIPPTKKFFKDEFSELSDAFNIMTEELDKQYTHLEDRVKVRTKELEISKIEAESANEAKTVFIANISHELRTPLNGILGMTSIAMDERDASRIQDSLKLIHRSGELLLHILTELLTYSKNTLNRSKLEKSNFQVLEIVYQVQSIFSKLALDQRVNLRILLKPNSIRKLILYGDCNRIIQIVMNLVSNSLKFTPVDGSVGVTFKLLGEYDHARSKMAEFKQVYVKDNAKDMDDTNEDTRSVTTINSNQYDEIVNSAFTNENKPLPPLPKIMEEEIDPLLCNDEDSSDIEGEKFEETKLMPQKLRPDPNEKKTPSSESIPIEELSRAHFNRTGSYSSTKDELEIHKKDKSYRIKRLARSKSWVIQIQVTDTGPGIEPALQEKVFEPFIQGDQTLSRSYGGTGLGLSICRQLATMMKGTLTLKSEIGVGSTFTFTAPLPQTHEIIVKPEDLKDFCEDEFNPDSKMNRKVAFDENVLFSEDKREQQQEGQHSDPFSADANDATSHDPESVTKPPEVSSDSKSSSPSSTVVSTTTEKKLEAPQFEKPHLITRGSTGTANSAKFSDHSSSSHDKALSDRISDLNVLVAEDNMVNQEVIKRMLKLEGIINISMACNGAEAIDRLEESIEDGEPFDMVFMDIQMPKVDGLLATRRIRQNLNYNGPIIALTAFADESNVKECLNSGMSGFLSKPIKRTNLRKIITEFTSNMDYNGFEVNGELKVPAHPQQHFQHSPLGSQQFEQHHHLLQGSDSEIGIGHQLQLQQQQQQQQQMHSQSRKPSPSGAGIVNHNYQQQTTPPRNQHQHSSTSSTSPPTKPMYYNIRQKSSDSYASPLPPPHSADRQQRLPTPPPKGQYTNGNSVPPSPHHNT